MRGLCHCCYESNKVLKIEKGRISCVECWCSN